MTNDVKLDLYNAVEEALIAITDFKNVLKFNSQDVHDSDEKKRRYPQTWIEFSDISWDPSKLKPDQANSTQEQNGIIQITIHIESFSLKDDNDIFKSDLELISKVYRALTMLQGENFTPLQRIGEIDDINQNNVRDWQIVFTTQVTEAGVEIGQVDAAPVTIKIESREIIPVKKWSLPSKDELALMYTNLKAEGVGGFDEYGVYHSSTEEDAFNAWFIDFTYGHATGGGKATSNRVRACRSFIATAGAYSLRDTGPGGGLIFYINGITYYEAAPSDQSSGNWWSNIIDQLIGTTGTAIGTGQGNTLRIMEQVGHIDSAAKLCNDLPV